MRTFPTLFRTGPMFLVGLLLIAGSALRAQTNADIPRAAPAPVAQPSPAELAESYRQLRDQLRAAEQSIVNNRLEAEAAANTRAAALAEKLDTLRQTVMNDRERLQMETQRTAYERLQQQTMTQDLTRVVMLVGGAGLVALFAIAFLHWRGNRRLAEYAAAQLQIMPAANRPGLLPITPSDREPGNERVVQANERLVSVLDRMEQRVHELEQTAAAPAPAPNVVVDARRKVASKPAVTSGRTAQIKALLEQGQSFLNADNPVVALACYDEILSIDEHQAEALLKKGTALERLQKNDAALQYYDRAIEADPTLALAFIAKGGLLVRLERFDAAFECYEQAMRAGKAGNSGGTSRINIPADWPMKR